jgi:long-chain acyl-CoA synthetase
MTHRQVFERADADTALLLGDVPVSFQELRERIHARRHLVAALPPGIAVLEASRRLDFIVNSLALFEAGHPQALLAPDWTEPEQALRRQRLGPWFALDEHMSVIREERSSGPSPHAEAALILFTSGSTGAPRAVQLSRANVEANLHAVRASLDFHTAREQVLFLPLSYAFGLLGQLWPALVAGTRTRLVGNLVELKAIAEAGALRGMISGVPSHYETLARLLGATAFPDVTHVVSAGSALSVPLRQRLREAFPRAHLYANYGQTELSPRALCLRSDHPAFFTSATGYPAGNLSVKLTAEGELCIQGDQVMLGYLGDPQATHERLQDGWLRTGDTARIAPDGLVTVLGRNDDVLKVGGERIGPTELEAALQALPGVEAAAVCGQEDALYGTAILAFLELHQDAAPWSVRDVKLALRKSLSPHKIPSRYFVVERLPRTANGKLQRHLLAELMATSRSLT